MEAVSEVADINIVEVPVRIEVTKDFKTRTPVRVHRTAVPRSAVESEVVCRDHVSDIVAVASAIAVKVARDEVAVVLHLSVEIEVTDE